MIQSKDMVSFQVYFCIKAISNILFDFLFYTWQRFKKNLFDKTLRLKWFPSSLSMSGLFAILRRNVFARRFDMNPYMLGWKGGCMCVGGIVNGSSMCRVRFSGTCATHETAMMLQLCGTASCFKRNKINMKIIQLQLCEYNIKCISNAVY